MRAGGFARLAEAVRRRRCAPQCASRRAGAEWRRYFPRTPPISGRRRARRRGCLDRDRWRTSSTAATCGFACGPSRAKKLNASTRTALGVSAASNFAISGAAAACRQSASDAHGEGDDFLGWIRERGDGALHDGGGRHVRLVFQRRRIERGTSIRREHQLSETVTRRKIERKGRCESFMAEVGLV